MDVVTPGPWEFESRGVLEGVIVGPPETGSRMRPIVASLNHIESRDAGRLMAGAPDLLDACQGAYFLLDRIGDSRKDREIIEALREAIDKATGKES